VANKARNIVAAAAVAACLGAVVAWFLTRDRGEDSGKALDRARALGVLWAVIGVVRLVLELDD